jgi:hypothetical protein
MASFHFIVLDTKKEGSIEKYLIHSVVDDTRYGLLFEKEVHVNYVDGHTIIPKKEIQLAEMPQQIYSHYNAALKTYLSKERLNYYN